MTKLKNKSQQSAGVYVISHQAADGIASDVLRDHYERLRKELKQWKKNPWTNDNTSGHYLHPDDVVLNTRLIQAMELLLNQYFGDRA
jgi:hypothetical protein